MRNQGSTTDRSQNVANTSACQSCRKSQKIKFHYLKFHVLWAMDQYRLLAWSVFPEMQAQYFPNPIVAQKPVRVRLSCDYCSAAKVKCDKRRPACERCSSNQIHCTYSISRRHGSMRKVAREPALTGTSAIFKGQRRVLGVSQKEASPRYCWFLDVRQ